MNIQALIETAQEMVVVDKGLLAMDESIRTCNQRFATLGIAQNVETRRAYRELLLSTPGMNSYISGVILCDETIRQAAANGTPFINVALDAGLLLGIKVDGGTAELPSHPGEKVTEGLDGLRERLLSYALMGARFAKWRGVIALNNSVLPSLACIEANAHALARYAALCQEACLVPIVEPEVLMDGCHTQERRQQVTEAVLRSVFEQLSLQGVILEAMILKPNMVTAGLACPDQHTVQEVADVTMQCLLRVVPAAVAGIAFLSGGQSGSLASSRLNAMHLRYGSRYKSDTLLHAASSRTLPWPLSFSFARALQQPALEIWAGKDTNRDAAQHALLHRAQCNSAARRGDYIAAMES